MKIAKAAQKVILYQLFYETNNAGQIAPKQFPVENLVEVGNAKKKLGGIQEGNQIRFTDEEVEFSTGEAAELKKLFDAKKEWTADEAEVVLELKELFK